MNPLHPLFSTAASTPAPAALPPRSAIRTEDTWAVETIYADIAAWEADFARIDSVVAPLEAFRGRLNTPEAVLEYLTLDVVSDRLLAKLYTYAHLRADEDTANQTHQALNARIRAKWSDVESRLAWASPELLANDEATLRAWSELPALAAYRQTFLQLLRRKPHTLSEKEETLLARAGEILAAPYQVFNLLSNADLKFPDAADAEGKPLPLSEGKLRIYLESRDRTVRRTAFEGVLGAYRGVRNGLAANLGTAVKVHNFNAQTRGHASALAAALHPDHVPVSLYDSLVSSTTQALPALHDYFALVRRRLGLESLDQYDLYVPLAPKLDVHVPYEQACAWITEALRPLGPAYGEILRGAFANRWVDVPENQGKRSGAYSSGCYDSLPFILMNYNGTLNDVFTLAHELGHSIHTWLANHAQPPHLARYPIFIAEIASTLNEALLMDWLLREKGGDPVFRAYLVNHICDGFKGTVYRQTQFAEFERKIHEMDAAGQPLTADALTAAYKEINDRHHGPAVQAGELAGATWARIPHFYYNFYVYKYSTSFCASQIFVKQVLSGEAGRERYLDLLRAGGSDFPLDLVKRAGVDLTDPAVFGQAFAGFRRAVSELDGALAALDR